MAIGDGTGDIGWKKFLLAGWAFMECLFFGGLLYGWGSVNFVLKTEGIYADLCLLEVTNTTNTSSVYNVSGTISETDIIVMTTQKPSGNESGIDMKTPSAGDTQGECKPQDSKMALCFTIASAMFCVGCAVLGLFNYKYGTRLTRLIAFTLFVIGTLLMAFISKDSPWLMFPGLSLMGIGGLALLVTNTQVANLFVAGSSSIVGLLCGGFDMSSAVMLIVKIASENGFSRQNMFFIISGLHVLVLVSTFLFLPKMFIAKREVPKQQTEVAENGEAGIELLSSQTKGEAEKQTEEPTLVECLKRPLFLTHVFWLCLLQLRFFFFIGTLNQYLNRVLGGDKALVSYYTNVCFSTMMGGLITSFLSGIVYDWQRNLCKDGKSKVYREVRPAAVPLAIASLLCVILSVLVLIPYQPLLYVIFITMTVFRSFLYSLAAGLISNVFPSSYFGILYGIMIVCGGLFGFVQYAFFTWAEAYTEGALHANIFLLGMTSLSFIHPLYIWITSWKEERKFKVN